MDNNKFDSLWTQMAPDFEDARFVAYYTFAAPVSDDHELWIDYHAIFYAWDGL
jgi:hypothetical protein